MVEVAARPAAPGAAPVAPHDALLRRGAASSSSRSSPLVARRAEGPARRSSPRSSSPGRPGASAPQSWAKLARAQDGPRGRRRRGAEDRRREGAASSSATLGLPAERRRSLPPRWDSDAFRRPLGLSDGAGHVDDAKVGAALAAARASVRRRVPPPRGARARPPRASSASAAPPRSRRRCGRTASAYSYVAPGDGRDAPARLLPVRLRHRPLVHRPTIYNTNAPLSEIWVGFKNYVAILSRLHVAQHGRRRRPRLQLPELLLDALVTVVWTVTNVTFGVTVGPDPRAHPEHEGPRAEAGLPGAADPALGDAELHHGAHLEGDVPPAVRRGQPGPPDVRRRSRSPGSRRRSPRS